VDNFVDTLRATSAEARKIKGLAQLSGNSAFMQILMNQWLSAAMGFVAELRRLLFDIAVLCA
jgi:hypothetical protein